MLTVYDSKGQSYALTEQIGRGGEGAVFSCPDNYQMVAKIYHDPISAEKAEKLRWMAENTNDQLLKVAAWIVDVLFDAPNGKIVGFLMPNVQAKEIHELYSLKSRRIHFPEATWHFLVHTAANVARAFYSLHKNRHVMGDVNHGNCVVLADGTVKLIDCDSYSVNTGEIRYPCEVGVMTHLAPELHGVNLRDVERLPQHDNFGLAVIIFQLLFLGRHPFAGNYLGDADKSLEECIREHLFAYGDDAESRNVRQPPGSLPLSAASPRVASLFRRAFLTVDNRPEPREWIETLEDLSNSLQQCGLHPGHYYFEKLNACPWCEIELQTGLMLFPFVGKNGASGGQEIFNVFTVEKLITSFNVSQNLTARPFKPNVLPPPSPEMLEVKKTTRNRHIALVAIQLFVVVVFSVLLGFGSVCFLGLMLMIFMTIILDGSAKALRKDLKQQLYASRSEWNELENEWMQAEFSRKLNRDIAQIRSKIAEYQNLHQPDRRMGKSEIPENERQSLAEETAGMRRKVEKEIEMLLGAVRFGSVNLRHQQQKLIAKSEDLGKRLLQTESDLAALGSNAYAIIALVLVTFMVPIWGFAFSEMLFPSKSYSSSERTVSRPVSAPQIPSEPAVQPAIDYDLETSPVSEKITEKEIRLMSDAGRESAADRLYNQSLRWAYDKKDYEKAEQKLKLANRLLSKDIRILNQLGFVLYQQEKYSESLKFLNQSLQIEPENLATGIYIGMNYLRTEKYSAARDIFLKVTTGDPNSFAGFYNLGLAYEGLKKYYDAADAFRKAIVFSSEGDLDPHYELAICLYKLGNVTEARKEYDYILQKNPFLADRLAPEIGIK